ncbi:MAG: YncE family protein, partial [Nitrososphaeraceae archaeon]|nr:YncE family protein [Nitrososphaeraceae archaeon]
MIYPFLSAMFVILFFVLFFFPFQFEVELLYVKSSDWEFSLAWSHHQKVYAAEDNSSEKKGLIPTEAGINVNSYPIGIAINPLLKHIYVTNQFSNTLSIINSDNGKLLRTVQLDSSPYGIDNDIITNRIYTAIIGDDSIVIIDGTTGKLIHTIQKNVKTPVDVKVIPSQDLLYVTNIDNNTVSKFSTISNNIKQIIPVGESPYSLGSYQSDGNDNYIYVTNLRDGLISVILMNNTRQKDSDFTSDKIIANITLGGIPVGIGVNDVTKKIYVTNIQNNTLHIINITKDNKYDVIKTICSGYFDDKYLTQVNYQDR